MNEATELIDKNIDKLVDAIKAAGPSAEYGLQETLGYISVQAWATGVIIIIVCLTVPIVGFKWFKYGAKQEWSEYSNCWIGPVLWAIFGGVGLAFSISQAPSVFAKALHPVGHLVMQALK